MFNMRRDVSQQKQNTCIDISNPIFLFSSFKFITDISCTEYLVFDQTQHYHTEIQIVYKKKTIYFIQQDQESDFF